MTSQERVLTVCEFRPPDRIPRFDPFWEFPESWREAVGAPEEFNDIKIVWADESPFPSRARLLKEDGDSTYHADSWGRVIRGRKGAYFHEILEAAMPDGTDLDSIEFESPEMGSRYLLGYADEAERDQAVEEDKRNYCVFAKTGGPYIRSTFWRGQEQFLTDIAHDPGLARAIAEKTARHLAAVGVEEIRRFKLHSTGVWIYDDMAHIGGPMFSPNSFERVFLPAYRSMIRTYKEAGARYVFFHCDGNPRPLLDMLVDAGIDGLNPLERRAGMDMAEIRTSFPKLVLVGGMCNCDTLVNGPIERIEREAREIIDSGRDGGVVIGPHSIGPDVPLEHYLAYHRTCLTYGDFGSASPL